MSGALIDFHFDFETRSRKDLGKVGGVKYAADPSTEATLITWCFGRTGSVKAWRIGQRLPPELIDVMVNPGKYNFNAFNMEFDYMIWLVPFARLAASQGVTLVKPPLHNVTDTMALSQRFRTGNSLEACAKMLNVPMSKDKDGRRMMLKQCKPNGKTGEFVDLTAEEWIHFERYGILDTIILRECFYKLPQLPAVERWIFEWTFKRNLTGIEVDVDLIEAMDEIIKDSMPKLEAEFTSITGCKVKSPKALDYFQPHFPWIKNMQADTVREMQARTEGVDPVAVRALELKALAGSTSISKVTCAKNMIHHGKIYNLFSYHMAQTKRFAGRGIQIHNFPRPNYKAVDKLPTDLNQHDIASEVRARASTLQDPIDFVKNLLRRIWIAAPGKTLYCGDFSKVEPTFLYWLTGMGPVSPTAYEEMAVNIYSKPLSEISKDSEERQIGKAAVLGGGYGMGWKKFKDQVFKQTGIKLDDAFAKHVIDTYRKVNNPITQFWRDLQSAFRKAISGGSTALCDRKIFVMPMSPPWKGVQIRLPSGSYLYYHGAKVEVEIETIEVVEVINNVPTVREVQRANENLYYLVDTGRAIIKYNKVYGGLLTEHVTSATARDLLAHSMYNLDVDGHDVLSTVHDEIWGGATPGREEDFRSVMCKLPFWCKDLKVTADTDCGVRYLK